MKAQNKIKGIVYAYNTDDTQEEYALVRALGVEWIRMGLCIPWKDQMFGELDERYIQYRDAIRLTHAMGFQIMTTTPSLGCVAYDEERDEIRWFDSFPDYMGEKGTEEFYENVRKATCFMCEDLGEDAGIYWQCMNEIDNPVFTGEYPASLAAATARASAEGILRANPSARCGINLSCYNENAVRMADMVYAKGHPFYYCGVDQYFGSWQPGDVENWTGVIDALYERYALPVLANEWGYSSGGEYSPVYPSQKMLPAGFPAECAEKKWYYQVPGGHTPETAADYFTRGLKLFAEHPHCIGSFIFCWRDAYTCYHCKQPDCPSECYWGLVDKEGRPKPAYYTVQEALREYYE